MAIEIVDLAIDSMVIFHRFLYVYQRVLVGGLEHFFIFPNSWDDDSM